MFSKTFLVDSDGLRDTGKMITAGKGKSVTKYDVAKAANVSHMTVSRVLAGGDKVSEKTREKVMAACKKLNYRRNIMASSLRERKTNSLGVVVPNLEHNFYSRLTIGIEQACGDNGYHMIMVQAQGKKGKVKLSWVDFEFLLARQIDGILIDYPCTQDIIDRLKAEDVPVVFVDHPAGEEKFPFIASEDYKGSKILTQYLIDRGHRDIAYLSGGEAYYSGRQRYNGYKAALQENGLPVRDELVIDSNFGLYKGYDSARDLLDTGIKFTALMGGNDYTAIGAIKALTDAGVKVPEDVSVVGFAGDIISGFTVPALTTMLQPAEDIGGEAVKMLLRMVDGEKLNDSGLRVLLDTRLCERESVRDITSG